MVSMVTCQLEITQRSDLGGCGCVQLTSETYLWFQGLVNLVNGLTDRHWGFTTEKESATCIDLPNLIKYFVR